MATSPKTTFSVTELTSFTDPDLEDLLQLVAAVDPEVIDAPSHMEHMINLFEFRVSNPYHGTFVARDNRSSRIIGMLDFARTDQENTLHLDALIVDSSNRNRGIGEALVRLSRDYAEQNDLEILKTVGTEGDHSFENPAFRLLMRLGFESVQDGKQMALDLHES